MHQWNEIRLEDVRAINTRLALAKIHKWQDDIHNWSKEVYKELVRYEQMMTDIERNWNSYDDDVQSIYDATSLCYLLLGGQMTGIDIDKEISKLVKSYYKVEEN